MQQTLFFSALADPVHPRQRIIPPPTLIGTPQTVITGASSLMVGDILWRKNAYWMVANRREDSQGESLALRLHYLTGELEEEASPIHYCYAHAEEAFSRVEDRKTLAVLKTRLARKTEPLGRAA